MKPLTVLLPPRPAWMDEGLCAQVDPALWYPDESGDSGQAAKRICRRCPVKQSCLDYSLQTREKFGIWGGISERARQRMLRLTP